MAVREQFLSLFDFDTDWFYLKVLVVIIIIFKLITIWQTSGLKFHYNQKDKLAVEFVNQSKISQCVYRPYWLTISPLFQALVYISYEEFQQYFFPEEFDREFVMADDGGTLGIDWAKDKDGGRPTADCRRPILLLAPGLGGGARNSYTLVLLQEARKAGFKVGTMLFRGGEQLPITSGKLSYSGSWADCKKLVEHVHAKYVKPVANKRMYAFGCSLGAQILALYLRKEGKKACSYLDGCVFYGTPWSTSKGSDFFYKNAFGIYQKVIGVNLSNQIHKKQLPLMKKYLSKEDYEHYDNVLANNWEGLNVIDEHVYCRMFGFKDKQDYYDQVTIGEYATNIRVPTFCLDAKDDQITGHSFAPFKAAQSAESKLILAHTTHGAHVCHMEGHFLPRPWYYKPCLEYLQFMEARSAFKKTD